MTLYLTGPSAIEYWRRCDPTARRRTRAASPFGIFGNESFSFRSSELTDLVNAATDWLSTPVHLLVPDASLRVRSEHIVPHVCSRRLPEGSFSKIAPDVMIPSVELSCATVATTTSFPLFVELLFEFCGRYRLPNGRTGDMAEREPVTSVGKLASFADKVRGLPGAAALKKAARYVCDNSLSPMESDIAEMMLLDPRTGGFGLEKPQLNRRFEVVKKNRRALPQSEYRPDLYWPQANISLEYESDKHHRAERKLSKDAIRRNGIEHLGTRVITLTWEQARNYYEFERVAMLVASATGKRRTSNWDRWAGQRIKLHRLLMQR